MSEIIRSNTESIAEASTATEPLKIPIVSFIIINTVAVAVDTIVAFFCKVIIFPYFFEIIQKKIEEEDKT